MKYLLIDGNNLAIRSAFANNELSNGDGVPTGVHFGVFNSLINLNEKYPDYQFLVVWDGKSKRRMAESEEGVKKGLIQSTYKANRKKDEVPQALLDFYDQSPFLKKAIGKTGIPQIRLSEYETDDVIASYCHKFKNDEVLCVTSDKDFYQLLSDNVSLWDGMKEKLTTKDEWEKEFGITPKQYVDCGALSGDSGDNIFGIPGWGEKGALKAIKECGSWEKVINAYEEKYKDIRSDFPDLKNNKDEFDRLVNISTKSGKPKYPDITIDMPWTGVTLAVEDKKTKNIKKTILMALMFKERVRLAYSLKKMDDDINDLPEVRQGKFDPDKILEYLEYYDMETLKGKVGILRR